MSVVMGTIIGLVGFLAFISGGIVGYMQALSDVESTQRSKDNVPNGVTPQRSAWGRSEIVDGDK